VIEGDTVASAASRSIRQYQAASGSLWQSQAVSGSIGSIAQYETAGSIGSMKPLAVSAV
jgi:hypothetical protein